MTNNEAMKVGFAKATRPIDWTLPSNERLWAETQMQLRQVARFAGRKALADAMSTTTPSLYQWINSRDRHPMGERTWRRWHVRFTRAASRLIEKYGLEPVNAHTLYRRHRLGDFATPHFFYAHAPELIELSWQEIWEMDAGVAFWVHTSREFAPNGEPLAVLAQKTGARALHAFATSTVCYRSLRDWPKEDRPLVVVAPVDAAPVSEEQPLAQTFYDSADRCVNEGLSSYNFLKLGAVYNAPTTAQRAEHERLEEEINRNYDRMKYPD